MLPGLGELVDAHAFMKRRYRWRRPLDVIGLEEALREAGALSGGRTDDEPAALLYALLRRPNDLTDAWPQLAYIIVENFARVALGADVRLDDLEDMELRALRMRVNARVVADRATFEDVRAFLATRVRRQT
jgi:hypothetical protein